MTVRYEAGKGMYVTFPGMTILLPPTMTITGIANHLREVQEWLA